MDVDNVDPIASSVPNVDRNKIECIPKTNQPVELQDVTGLTVYDASRFEREVLQQVADDVLDSRTVVGGVPTALGGLALEETENERKIRMGEMTPFGSTDVSRGRFAGSSADDTLQKYLSSQSKLSTMVRERRRETSRATNGPGTVADPAGTSTDGGSDGWSGTEYAPSTDSDGGTSVGEVGRKSRPRRKSRKTAANGPDGERRETGRRRPRGTLDDGTAEDYQHRLRDYEKTNPELVTGNDDLFHRVDGDYLKVPTDTWERLYKYQKIGVKWLWELHQQGSGGILGDEMGLGKTVQMIVYLSALYWSRLKDKITGMRGLGPTVIVCPATLMHQWVEEFHKWCPPIRVVVLHDTGAYKGDSLDLIKDACSDKSVVITTYSGLLSHVDGLLKNDWHYVILDEGHKIRNPNSKITAAAKQLRSSHRFIISGSPIQNNLKELWSLFDFIFPGKLGTLPGFMKSFAVPITHGGYANATELQITTAYQCATILKDAITPYLLRRMKADVQTHISLPNKNEQVLFCRLTDEQKTMYRGFLENSNVIPEIMNGNCKVFVCISRLRTICNHPDLFHPNLETGSFGYWKKSGKMIVVEALLKMWKKQGHRVLLFTQSVKMLNIFQKFVTEQNYSYLKLEGTTYIGSRQSIINKFNQDSSIFVMILTTKVGGLGVNLIGADRVIIYDPDWNPATDLQARERAWRIGQTNPVTIYRLLTAGTIEEKIYHRQIFKQFLSNKILVDPKQRRFFKSNYLYELFTLQDVDDNGVVETADLFAGTGSEIDLKRIRMARHERKKSTSNCSFSADKIEAMKRKARELSRMIVERSRPAAPSDTRVDVEPRGAKVADGGSSPRAGDGHSSRDDDDHDHDHDHDHGVSPDSAVRRKRSKAHGPSAKRGRMRIPYLVKSDVYQEANVDDLASRKQDDYVLEKLFNRSGVRAALRHDKIMDASGSDYVVIENEAKKLARKAVEELEASRAQCWAPGSGRLNWTGNRGTVKPTLFLDGPAENGSSILSAMKKRNGFVEAKEREMQMLNGIKDYLLENDGCVSTDQLVDRFRNEYPAEDTPLFKSLLSEICTFNRCPDKTGVWTLKPKYR